ncbi:hypothetical protein XELAEV_18015889mg [Xenopus laevis]|uniref:Uncharacterized protein n=1 Tax=Xenopus laevis TaxID=8355 RepID=A0A974DL98_XENLA|nr:hypothetical protein XELAEV_18015889mg [Xenopus laevis]
MCIESDLLTIHLLHAAKTLIPRWWKSPQHPSHAEWMALVTAGWGWKVSSHKTVTSSGSQGTRRRQRGWGSSSGTWGKFSVEQTFPRKL